MDQYMPGAIRRIRSTIPAELLQKLEVLHPYETFMQKYIPHLLSQHGVKPQRSYYGDCVSNTGIGYMYSICQCAYRGYDHVDAYIRKMLRISVICGINTADEAKYICEKNQLQEVRIDDEEGKDRY